MHPKFNLDQPQQKDFKFYTGIVWNIRMGKTLTCEVAPYADRFVIGTDTLHTSWLAGTSDLVELVSLCRSGHGSGVKHADTSSASR